jgi:phenol hydroxylase P4 protein
MPFGALIEEVIPEGFGQHPQFKEINWDTVEWTLNHAPFTPDPTKGLEEQGLDHKCLLRFSTPGLVETLD